MEKEFEALEILKKQNSKSTSERYYYPVNTRRNAVNIIEQALTELKAIKEAKPSEALECLENIRERFSDDSKGNNSWGFKISKELNTIKQALTELKEIKEAKPSEAMECLDKLAKQIELDEDIDFWEIRNAHKKVEQALMQRETNSMYVEKLANKEIEYIHTINELKQALTTKSKKEMAFDVIREKNVNVYQLHKALKLSKGTLTYEYYINNYGSYHSGMKVDLLTKEEFELLKEVLGNDK